MSLQSTQEEQQILEAAHSKILLGNYVSAFKDIQKVLDKLEKSAPSLDSWQLIAKALAMKGFALSKQKKARASEEAFAAILRVDFTYQLDSFIFPPTVVQSFEQLRQEMGKQKRARLRLTSPFEGATVFANGVPLGRVPLERELLPGHYSIVLGRGGRVSEAVAVQLSAEEPNVLDIPVQWELAWAKALCIQEKGEFAVEVTKQMAKELGADYLVQVVIANTSKKGMRAVLWGLEKDERIREGGIWLAGDGRREPQERLVDFIILGKLRQWEHLVLPVNERGELLESSDIPKRPPPERYSEKEALNLPPASAPAKVIRGNTMRTLSWLLIGAGGGLILGAGFSEIYSLVAASDANQILQKYGGDKAQVDNSAERFRYKAFESRKQDSQQIAIIMGATGLVTLTTGLVLFFVLPPKAEGPSLSVAPHFGVDGGGVVVVGRF
ncbi:MAG: hypothetical protein FWC28_05210 [Proteobacteria bacterium]|nr:hypothetical protein [Pseudomonadota bacterium]